ncbi:hypothetical protein WA1_30640 [Scytonema hofmannii PCC 7110]|uniref:Uncharacterized protein n=1 Tax=Scytonema hofmannii PCC 7110 TaxID=128403 RepID=A0A139X4Z8_9CYAN|nr:hypothetical protein WA1_30640 [Scytonema hofmannii PCC 7110]
MLTNKLTLYINHKLVYGQFCFKKLYHFGFWILDFGLRKPYLDLTLNRLSVAFFFQIGIRLGRSPIS